MDVPDEQISAPGAMVGGSPDERIGSCPRRNQDGWRPDSSLPKGSIWIHTFDTFVGPVNSGYEFMSILQRQLEHQVTHFERYPIRVVHYNPYQVRLP